MYYRRYTRMHLRPAFKYFSKYGLISAQYLRLTPLMSQEAVESDHYRPKLIVKKEEKAFDTKLIERLFLRYPDLKYEPISNQKYLGRQQKGKETSAFSYAYAFITEQKKLIKAGYTLDKSFEIVEKKYQQRMARKLNQTLLSRGLAIGNRARSILSIYQQQNQYESRLKTTRTQRQLDKYLMKEEIVKNLAEGTDNILDEEVTQYGKVLHMVVEKIEKGLQEKNEDSDLQQQDNNKETRQEEIEQLEAKFKNLFARFYERVSAKDRLEGLTDEELINEIGATPKRIKKKTKDLLNFLQKHDATATLVEGKVKVTGNLPKDVTRFLEESPYVKMAILNRELNYEKPRHTVNVSWSSQTKKVLKSRVELRRLIPMSFTKEEEDQLKMTKRKDFQFVVEEEIPTTKGSYKLFESAAERMLRLEITYYDLLAEEIKQAEAKRTVEQQLAGSEAKESVKQKQQQADIKKNNEEEVNRIETSRKEAVQKLRRLKFRLEQRYRNASYKDLIFNEHEAMRENMNFEAEGEYEQLLGYLRRKTEARRLTSLDQVNDNRINKYLEKIDILEGPQREGDVNVAN